MVKDMQGLPPSTRLLTLLNVQSAKPSSGTNKRTRDWHLLARKAQKSHPGTSARTDKARHVLGDKLEQAAQLLDSHDSPAAPTAGDAAEQKAALTTQEDAADDSDDDDAAPGAAADPFTRHFGPDSSLVRGKDKAQLELEHDTQVKKHKAVLPGLGDAQVLRPEAVADDEGRVKPADEAFKAVRCPLSFPSAVATPSSFVDSTLHTVQPQAPRQDALVVLAKCVAPTLSFPFRSLTLPLSLSVQPPFRRRSPHGSAPCRRTRTCCARASLSAATSTTPCARRRRCTP